ncbi:nuclear transport factor 2 family protein [Mycobacterium sp. SMC-4]|uniref:nuclear transport factor 2 family protein n=1 Tax=Mycobacterium sp. SMC-4 TaxID=2857059 RepID=UPI003CFE52B6
MAFDAVAVARAFSEHRFDDALDHLAPDVKWTIVGGMVLEGADAVRRTCADTTESLKGARVEFDRCVIAAGRGMDSAAGRGMDSAAGRGMDSAAGRGIDSAGDGQVVAVDTLVRYVRSDGLTAVASCAIYEFDGEQITTITSYAVEVDPEDAGAQPPPRG